MDTTTYLTHRDEIFVWTGGYETRMTPKAAGFRWNPARKHWWTDDEAKAVLLSEYADDEAKPLLDGVHNALEQSRSHEAPKDFTPNIPEGEELFPYQASGAAWLTSHPNTLLGDEMGLGKTVQVAVALNHVERDGKPVLIICPASLKRNWEAELKTWLTWDARIQVLSGGRDKVDALADIVIVNYDICHKGGTGKSLKAVPEWSVLVCDESHYLKNPKALRTKGILGTPAKKKARKVVEEAKPGFADKATHRWMLTGTPIPNRPVELQPVLAKLDPQRFGHFFRFALRYCNAHQNGYGWDFNGASNLEELQTVLRSSVMLRRLKADVLTELPAKLRGVVVMEPNAECAEVLKREADYNPDELADMLNEGITPAFDEMSTVRADLAAAKAPLVAEYVREQIEAGLEKVVVFGHHKSMIRRLESELAEFGVVSITGETPTADRQDIVQQFQADPNTKVFVGNIIAAGVGLTLTAASRVIMAELDWVPGNVTQAEDRCHRIGQKDTVQVTHLVVDGSLDARLVKTLIAKQRVMDKALDDTPEINIPKPQDAPQNAPKAKAQPKTRKDKLVAAEKRWGALTAERIEAIHEALARMSGLDSDRAGRRNNVGWNGRDTNFGHSLSEQAATGTLSDMQLYSALKMLNTYKNTQLADLADALFPEDA